jgi:hypothetical protein
MPRQRSKHGDLPLARNGGLPQDDPAQPEGAKEDAKDAMNVRLPSWMVKALKHRSIEEGVRISKLLEGIVREYLEKTDPTSKAYPHIHSR